MIHPLELGVGASPPVKHKFVILCKIGFNLKNFFTSVTMSVTKSKAPKSVHSYGGIVVRNAIEAKKKKAKLNSCVPKPHPQPSEKTHLGQSSLWGHTTV